MLSGACLNEVVAERPMVHHGDYGPAMKQAPQTGRAGVVSTTPARFIRTESQAYLTTTRAGPKSVSPEW